MLKFSLCVAASCATIGGVLPLPGASAVEPVKIGVSVADSRNDVFNQIRQAIEASAKEKGATLVAVDAEDGVASQVSQVAAMLKQNIRALIVIPAGPRPTAVPVAAAKAAGIPVVTVDRNPADAPGDTFIGTDNVAGARVLGDYACRVTGGKAELFIIESTLHTRHEDERNKGFAEAMRHCPGIDEAMRDWTHKSAPQEGFTYAERALIANPDISLIFGRVDALALGAARAVEAAQLDHKVLVIGFDGDGAGLQAVKDGRLEATMTQPTRRMGTLALTSALALVAGQTVPAQQMQDAVLATRDNVDQLIAEHP